MKVVQDIEGSPIAPLELRFAKSELLDPITISASKVVVVVLVEDEDDEVNLEREEERGGAERVKRRKVVDY